MFALPDGHGQGKLPPRFAGTSLGGAWLLSGGSGAVPGRKKQRAQPRFVDCARRVASTVDDAAYLTPTPEPLGTRLNGEMICAVRLAIIRFRLLTDGSPQEGSGSAVPHPAARRRPTPSLQEALEAEGERLGCQRRASELLRHRPGTR
jgi:hypothetical protein